MKNKNTYFNKNSYSLANSDANTNDIPFRDTNGIYHFSTGQRQILSSFATPLMSAYHSLVASNIKRSRLAQDLLRYQSDFEEYTEENLAKQASLNDELEKTKRDLVTISKEKERYKDGLIKRGIIVNDNAGRGKQLDQKEPIQNNNNSLSEGIKIFAGYVLLEGFMVIIQWSTLNETKSIPEIILRMVTLLLVVCLFHWGSKKARDTEHGIYTLFSVYNIIIIGFIIFLPPILNYYFVELNTSDALDLWQIKTAYNEAAISGPEKNLGIVDFYLKNDWILGATSIVIFLCIQGLVKDKNSKNSIKSVNDTVKADAVNADLERSVNIVHQYEYNVRELQEEVRSLEEKIRFVKTDSNDLKNLLDVLAPMRVEIERISFEMNKLIQSIEAELLILMDGLAVYSVDLKDIIKSDPIKNLIYNFDPPTRNDIFFYLNITNHEDFK